MFAAVKDISKLLEGIPKGAWVALSEDEERVIAYSAELQQVLQKAREAHVERPIIVRVPESDAASLIL